MKKDLNRSVHDYIISDWNCNDKYCVDDIFAIKRLVNKHCKGGSWLDIGSGPMGVLWHKLFAVTGAFICCDIQRELVSFYKQHDTSSSVENFLKQYFPVLNCTHLGGLPLFNLWDATNNNPEWVEQFDNVIQIGCFGCLSSFEAMQAAVSYAHSYLRHNGLFYSWTWIPRDDFYESSQWGGDSLRMLTTNDIEISAQKCGFSIVESEVTVISSARYEKRIGYVFRAIK